MFELDRSKKLSAILFIVAAAAAVLSVVGFMRGGGELLFDGFMNEPGAVALMLASFGVFAASLIGGIALRAVSRDVAELLRYMSGKNDTDTKNR